MLLKQIELVNFRNLKKGNFTFNPFLTVILGVNSAGKTNIIEGIYLSIYGSGFRESKEEELVHFNLTSGIAQILASFSIDDVQNHFKIALTKKGDKVEKTFFINKSKKSLRAYIKEQTKAVLFAPSHIEIITGSPSARRDYFNKLLSSFDFEYKKRLTNYEQALRRRNKILESFSSVEAIKKELTFWDQYLEEQSIYLTTKRQEYIDFLNTHPEIKEYSFFVEYNKNEFTRQKASTNIELESRIKKTIFGPQRDEFIIWLKNSTDKNIHHFGSRSEQRLAVLWLKMGEIYYFEETMKVKPLLLFDDIFSELDMKNKKLVLDLIKKYQSVMTTTEPEVLDMVEVPTSVIKV